MGGVNITQQQLDQFLRHAREHAHVVALPMRTRFRGIDTREAMLVPTPGGWVEFAPFLEYGPAESSRWLRSAVVHSLLLDDDATARPQGANADHAALQVPAGVGVSVNATMPAVDAQANPQQVGELMARYPGCTTVKVKVAEPAILREQGFEASMAQDVARVRAVRAWFAEQGVDRPRIRVDANAGWSVDQALAVITQLAAEDVAGECLDYVEQPCATVAELAELRQRLADEGIAPGGSPVRIAADELIRKASDPLAVVEAGACDVAVVKVAPLGGIDQVVKVARQVAAHGVSLTLSSALDTAVGIGAGLQAAALVAQVGKDAGVFGQDGPNAAGLATGSLFTADVGSREIRDGAMLTGAVQPDPAVLERYAVDAERRQWWVRRMEAAAAELGS